MLRRKENKWVYSKKGKQEAQLSHFFRMKAKRDDGGNKLPIKECTD